MNKGVITATEDKVSSSENRSENKDVICLIERVRNRDQGAFKELADRYAPLIESLVNKFYDSEISGMNREDLRQEAILRFYNSILTYE